MAQSSGLNSGSSVIAGWAITADRALQGLNLDSDAIFTKAGIRLSTELSVESRFSSRQTQAFWQQAKLAAGRADIGLEVAKQACPASFHALGHSLWASACLLDVLKRLCQYEQMLNDGCSLSFTVDGYVASFAMDINLCDEKPLVQHEGVDYFLGACLKLMRDIKPGELRPLKVWLQRPKPSKPTPWLEFYDCEVEFASQDNCLQFDMALLQQTLTSANPQLAAESDKLAAQYLQRHQYQDTLSQVESAIKTLMPRGDISLVLVAEELGLSSRSLQYRLDQQGCSYKTLLNDIRQRLARRYLQFSQKSISEIAYSLGFSDPSHFNRAFKRWTGKNPGQFRKACS